MPRNTLCVTGANGFVGSALLRTLSRTTDRPVIGLTRGGAFSPPAAVKMYRVDDLAACSAEHLPWADMDVIVHCAARVHVMNDPAADPLQAFRHVNVAGTLQLARLAAEAGVRRFVFLSSIKVNGEQTFPGQPFRPDQEPAPLDPYGLSKYEAELGLQALSRKTGMEVVIIRPPLVYGPGVRANFLAMMRWLSRGIPLPLGGVTDNRRSLVALDNLVDLIVLCLDHPAAANQILLVSDAEDLSTAELLRRMAQALGRTARLLPVPPGVLRLGAKMLGRSSVAERLCGSLQVDISKTRELLAWSPPLGVNEGLRRTAEHWLQSEEG